MQNKREQIIIDKEIINPQHPLYYKGDTVFYESISNAAITAKGHIIIHGGCGSSSLTSEQGSVFLLFGSMQETNITSFHNIYVKHTQNSILKAGKDVIIESSVFKSNITAGDRVISEAIDSKIIGGKVTAKNEINIDIIGNDKGVETILAVENPEGIVRSTLLYPGAYISIGKLPPYKISRIIKGRIKLSIKNKQVHLENI